MKTNLPGGKKEKEKKRQPLEIIKVGNVSLPVYRHTNIIPQRDPAGKILYGPPDAKGNRRALIKYQSDIYLPKDHDELNAVELADEDNGDIEIFTPLELRKLFNACLTPVKERAKMRDREAMVPYLAIAAFCGLRAAEIARLDWSEVHLTGAEHFIEVKASKAKTASRRTVPISDNCAAWLAPFAKESGPVCPFERPDKQCFYYVGPAAKVEWKRNGLRHSFISYRLAQIKNVHQVSLEAGNSPQMVFAHYRQLVTETQASISCSPRHPSALQIDPPAASGNWPLRFRA